MAKVLAFWLFAILFLPSYAQAKESPLFCMVDSSGEKFEFYCHDANVGENYQASVDPILSGEFSARMQDMGVEIVEAEEYLRRTLFSHTEGARNGPVVCESCLEREYRSFFVFKEFNSLDPNSAVIRHLRLLAESLHKGGVCEVETKVENYNSIGVNNADDVLQHFLCIANSESVFGQRNIGMGGRGPWGIHPMHNLKKGNKIPGSSKRMDRDGLCYGTQAIARDQYGTEIKRSEAYRDPQVILDNAACAVKLYRLNRPHDGFKAWGTGTAWGSNRHCSSSTKKKFQFKKYLGELACCSAACKSALKKEQHL